VALSQSGASYEVSIDKVVNHFDTQCIASIVCSGSTVMGLTGLPPIMAPSSPKSLRSRMLEEMKEVNIAKHEAEVAAEAEKPVHVTTALELVQETILEPASNIPAEFRDLTSLWDASAPEKAPPLLGSVALPILDPTMSAKKKEGSGSMQLALGADSGDQTALSVAVVPSAQETGVSLQPPLRPTLQANLNEMIHDLGEGQLVANFYEKPPSTVVAEIGDQLQESKGDANVMFEWVKDVADNIDRVQKEKDALLLRKAALDEENARQNKAYEEACLKRASLENSLTKVIGKADAEMLQIMESEAWNNAQAENRNVKEEVDRLRAALKLIKQQGDEMVKEEADAVLADASLELEVTKMTYQGIARTSPGRKKWKITEGDAFFSVVKQEKLREDEAKRLEEEQAEITNLKAKELAMETQLQESHRARLDAKKEELKAKSAMEGAQAKVSHLDQRLQGAIASLPAAVQAIEGEDEGPAAYKAYMRDHEARTAHHKVARLREQLAEAEQQQDEAELAYKAKVGAAASVPSRSPAMDMGTVPKGTWFKTGASGKLTLSSLN